MAISPIQGYIERIRYENKDKEEPMPAWHRGVGGGGWSQNDFKMYFDEYIVHVLRLKGFNWKTKRCDFESIWDEYKDEYIEHCRKHDHDLVPYIQEDITARR